MPVNSVEVNFDPWTVLKIFGLPNRANAVSSAETQNPVSIVFDTRNVSTDRLCQSMIAARHRKSRSITRARGK